MGESSCTYIIICEQKKKKTPKYMFNEIWILYRIDIDWIAKEKCFTRNKLKNVTH